MTELQCNPVNSTEYAGLGDLQTLAMMATICNQHAVKDAIVVRRVGAQST